MNKQQELDALLAKAQEIVDGGKSENRNLTDEEHAEATRLMGEAMQIRDSMKSDARDEQLKAKLAELFDGTRDGEGQSAEPRQKAVARSVADQVLSSEEWKGFMRANSRDGVIPETRKGLRINPIDVKGGFGLWGRKDLVAGADATTAGAFIVADDTGIYEPIGRYPTVLRDLISVRTTGSDTVEWVRQTQQVSEAEPVPEANVKEVTGATGEITGTKPQGAMHFERVSTTVKTIAVWVGVTKRALADAGQIRGIINQELREDLADELENQLFNGDGIGENFLGLANQPGTLQQAFGVDILTTTRRAITTLLVTGRQVPTAWTFNPLNWETVELIQDNDGRYYHNGPLNQGPMRLWGVPVVQSFHQAAGSAWLANWRKAVLWDREQSTISATDSHDDWFVRNLVAVLAEMRAAFGLIRSSGFIEALLS
jgi:HK97 family phage major capsid protein